MMPIETVAVFFAASVALALAPGPDNIFVLTQSAIHGRKAGLLVTIGLCTGLVVHTAAVSVGVAAVFQSSALAFNTLKILGAIYLLCLAWQAFKTGTTKIGESAELQIDSGKLYGRGVIMNITNPKVAIFFLAFLPQFVDPNMGSVTIQMITCGGLFIIATLLIFGAIACSAGFLGEWLKRSERAQVIMNRIAGTVYTGLAFRLAISER
jgi:threonine/homoserine/homoserine lactone efflux protein